MKSLDKTLRNNLSQLWNVNRELYYAIITPFEIGLMDTEKYEHKPESMHCLLCFKEIPENHLEKRMHHDNEHCPNCGNDFMGGRWFSQPAPKYKVDKIRDALISR